MTTPENQPQPEQDDWYFNPRLIVNHLAGNSLSASYKETSTASSFEEGCDLNPRISLDLDFQVPDPTEWE